MLLPVSLISLAWLPCLLSLYPIGDVHSLVGSSLVGRRLLPSVSKPPLPVGAAWSEPVTSCLAGVWVCLLSPSGRGIALGDSGRWRLSRGSWDGPPSCQLTHCCVALSLCRRSDALTVTPWLAPIIWEGTFNIDLLNEQFWLQNLTVGLTVFAVKK